MRHLDLTGRQSRYIRGHRPTPEGGQNRVPRLLQNRANTFMILPGHWDARHRMLHLIRQHMNSLISGDSQNSLRRHDPSDRPSASSRNTSTCRYRHDRRITFGDHRHHLDRSAGRRNRRHSYHSSRLRISTIRAFERYGDQIFIRSRFVYLAQTPSFTGTSYAHISIFIDLDL